MNKNLKLNNTKIECLFTSNLLELNIIKPEIQRIIDNEKVKDIIIFQLDFHRRNNYFNFTVSAPINIHIFKENYFLIDGQHRLEALTRLLQIHSHNIQTYVHFVTVDTQEELEFNYKMINMNTPLPDFSNFKLLNKNIPEKASAYFQLKYQDIWSKNIRNRRPHIYYNSFQETLAYITSKLNIRNDTKLIQIIDDYNNKLSRWPKTSFKNVSIKMYKKAKSTNFYLGLFKFHPTEVYGYEWARKIIELHTGQSIKKKTNKKKPKIKIRINKTKSKLNKTKPNKTRTSNKIKSKAKKIKIL